MPVTTGRSPREGLREAALRRDQSRRDQLALLLELRDVEHWRRLVAARLDLAVAAVAAVDEPVVRNVPAAPAAPFGLRELLGLGPPGSARDDVALLLRLREVRRELDAYACALRTQVRAATCELVSRLDDGGPGGGAAGADDALAPVLPLRRVAPSARDLTAPPEHAHGLGAASSAGSRSSAAD
jgi:hypothetical protein